MADAEALGDLPMSDDPEMAPRLPGLGLAAVASLGAGAVHAAAAGIHAEHVGLTRAFVAIAALQLGAGLWALLRPTRAAAAGLLAVNAIAVAAWLTTRLTGISGIDGLEVREAMQFTDVAAAALGATAFAGALAGLLAGWRRAPRPNLALMSVGIAMLAVPAMFTATEHTHSGSDHSVASAAGADGEGHAHDTATAVDDTAHAHDTVVVDPATDVVVWPRPYDPARPIDISGVPGVTADQEARARQLIVDTQQGLPVYADVQAAIDAGYQSIGDSQTGVEHFIRYDLIQDDTMLDASAPESLVYRVDGERRVLEGAMYIASARPTDDPTVSDYAGPLMTWHNHGDLCWDIVNGKPTIVGSTRTTGSCVRGVNTGGENPMVHVWIVPHPCGPFAALEGNGAGQSAVPEDERVDMCADHDHAAAPTVARPFDPTQPIDLSGVPGVTPEQQARAENLIATTVVGLPQWSDYRTAEAAGFRSIGDSLTGHEHFIQWDWINDDVALDPDFPESLVYTPGPNGTKQLVSAMYMLPEKVSLDDVPDVGGALMQWHIHDNLCFSSGSGPRVAGLTSADGTCPPGLDKFAAMPMIHVWIVATECGPFAALEGVGAGQTNVPDDQRVDRCQHTDH